VLKTVGVVEEVDDLVVAHFSAMFFPLPVSGLAAGLSLYPFALPTVGPCV